MSAQPWTPHTEARDALGTLVPPPQSAKPARKNARCGDGDGSPRPHPPHPQQVGSGPRPQAPRMGCWARESAQPQMPHTHMRGAPPPGASCCPHSAQSQLAKAGLPAGGRATPSQARGRRDRAPPQELNRRSKGSGNETRRGTNCVERLYGRPAPDPRVVRAPN